jgi:hypothetical protein
MTTAADIITQALKKAGLQQLGQAPDASDTNDALLDLNDMLAQWRRKRWLVYHLIDLAKTSTQAQTYTVGPGGDFPVAYRPNKIEAGFLRLTTNVGGLPIDYPLTVIPAREQFNALALKTLVSFPKYLFYDPAYPLGTVEAYPIPNASIYELHITVRDVLQNFANTGIAVNLPEEYIPALKFNLAKRLRQSYGKKADSELNNLARDALDTIRLDTIAVPELTMPRTLIRSGGLYNIYGDFTY